MKSKQANSAQCKCSLATHNYLVADRWCRRCRDRDGARMLWLGYLAVARESVINVCLYWLQALTVVPLSITSRSPIESRGNTQWRHIRRLYCSLIASAALRIEMLKHHTSDMRPNFAPFFNDYSELHIYTFVQTNMQLLELVKWKLLPPTSA